MSFASRCIAVCLLVPLAGCFTTSEKTAQGEPKYAREIALTPVALKDCITNDAPELYTIVERSGGYRIINAGSLGAVFVIDITPTLGGANVKGYAPGLFRSGRVDRCAAGS